MTARLADAGLHLQLYNTGNGVLNDLCGSDFVQKEKRMPLGFEGVPVGARYDVQGVLVCGGCLGAEFVFVLGDMHVLSRKTNMMYGMHTSHMRTLMHLHTHNVCQ